MNADKEYYSALAYAMDRFSADDIEKEVYGVESDYLPKKSPKASLMKPLVERRRGNKPKVNP